MPPRGWVLARLSLVAVILLLVSGITAQRVRLWGSNVYLWTEAVQRSPAKPRVWVNLGNAYADLDAEDLATQTYTTALDRAANPQRSRDEQIVGRALALNNLAVLSMLRGDRAAALNLVTTAEAVWPGQPPLEQTLQWIRRAPITSSH